MDEGHLLWERYLSLTSSSLISTSSKSAIFSRQAKSGCEVLVHHLLTVEGVTPNCPASQRAVRFFSNKTIFIRLISSIFNSLLHKGSDLFSISSRNNEIIENISHFLCFFMQNSAFSRPTYVHCLTNIGSHPLWTYLESPTNICSWKQRSPTAHLFQENEALPIL